MLDDNNISKIEGLDQLVYLMDLSLNNNKIQKIEGLGVNSLLMYLYLNNNKIECIEGLDGLSSLNYLYLNDNLINKLENFDSLVKLEVLDLLGNSINKIDGLSNLASLRSLSLSRNKLTKIENLESLSSLVELYLSDNFIDEIEGLNELSLLRVLNLHGNNIVIVKNMLKLSLLRVLDLSSNKIKNINDLSGLKFLEDLYLSDNSISDISGLNNLVSLKRVFISKNKINSVDGFYGIGEIIDRLSVVNIDDNPVWLKYGMVLNSYYKANHLEVVKNFFSELSSFKVVYLPCKVVFLGNHASGKSSLLSYLLRDGIDGLQESTHGLKVNVPVVNDENTNYGLPEMIYYDFGGQDFYHGIYRLFIRQKSLKILLVDSENNTNKLRIENKETVDGIQKTQNFNLNYWFAQINYMQENNMSNDEIYCSEKDTLLVQSHCIDYSYLSWKLTNVAGRERIYRFFGLNLNQFVLKEKNSISFYDLQHFKLTLELAAKGYRQKVLLTPERIQLTKDVLDIIRRDRLEDAEPIKVSLFKAKKFGDNYSESWLKLQLEQLSAAGLVLYDRKVAGGEYVWLNPKVLVDYIHQKILPDKLIRRSSNQGVIKSDYFEKKKINKETIELLEYYRIIFKHQPDKFNDCKIEYIIPNYLPLVDSNDTLVALSTFGLNKPSFILRFLRFIPVGMINHLVCFFGRQPDKKLFWRDMMVFTLSQGPSSRYRIHIKLDFSKLEIQVCVDGEERDYTSVCKYLFYCLMRFYWDIHAKDESALTYAEFYKLTAKHGTYSNKDELADMEQQDDELLFDEDEEVWQDFYGKNGGVAGVANDDYVPDDLYVSLNGESFVKYSQLLNHDEKEPLIKAYSLLVKEESDDVEPIALPQGVAVQDFAIFTQRTFTSVKKIFISYSRMDVSYKNELSLVLKTSLESGGHEVWDCGELELGKWDGQIKHKLKEADLIICMLSINFFASNYIVHHELIETLGGMENGSSQQIMCVVVKAFPWDSFSRLGKQAKWGDDRIGDLKQQLEAEFKLDPNNTKEAQLSVDEAKAKITEYQFLPYRYHAQSSIRGEHVQRITPLASLSDADRDEVYVEIEGRVRKALGI